MEGRTTERIMFNRMKCVHFPFGFFFFCLALWPPYLRTPPRNVCFYKDKGSGLFCVAFYFHFIWQIFYYLWSVSLASCLRLIVGFRSHTWFLSLAVAIGWLSICHSDKQAKKCEAQWIAVQRMKCTFVFCQFLNDLCTCPKVNEHCAVKNYSLRSLEAKPQKRALWRVLIPVILKSFSWNSDAKTET